MKAEVKPAASDVTTQEEEKPAATDQVVVARRRSVSIEKDRRSPHDNDVIVVKTERAPTALTPPVACSSVGLVNQAMAPTPPLVAAPRLPLPILPRPPPRPRLPQAPRLATRMALHPPPRFAPFVPHPAHTKIPHRLPVKRYELDIHYTIGHYTGPSTSDSAVRAAPFNAPPTRDASVKGFERPLFVHRPRRNPDAQPRLAHQPRTPLREPDFLQRRTCASAGPLQIPAFPQHPTSSASCSTTSQQSDDAPLNLCVRRRPGDVNYDEPLNLCVRRDVTHAPTAHNVLSRDAARGPDRLSFVSPAELAQVPFGMPRPAHAHSANPRMPSRQLRPAHCSGSWPKPEAVLPSNPLTRVAPPNVTVRAPVTSPVVGSTAPLIHPFTRAGAPMMYSNMTTVVSVQHDKSQCLKPRNSVH